MMNKRIVIGLMTIGLSLISGILTSILAQDVSRRPTTQSGAIAGRVINYNGEPVSGAEVSVDSTFELTRIRPHAETNSNGEFIITGLSPGIYKLYAAKEEEGYAPTDSPFRSNGSGSVLYAQVNANQLTRNFVIQLGKKGAWLVGRIVDSRTDKPVETARITLRRADEPQKFFRTGVNQPGKGTFKVLIPTVPFTIEISAPGYADWHYIGSDKSSNFLRLESGKSTKIVVTLQSTK